MMNNNTGFNIHPNPDKSKLRVKVGTFLTQKCFEALKQTGEFFMSNLTPQDAYQLKKKIRRRHDLILISWPASYTVEGEELSGYWFKINKELSTT